MSYAHSIIQMLNFFECPSHHIEVVVIPVTELNYDTKDIDGIDHD
jgi:hypothetical protein